MDCAADEFSLYGECLKCPSCRPGFELQQECGYGVGGASECATCKQRWFKENWGSQSCRMCQTCRRLNRREISPCTHTHNAVCGDCLPGFYSKMRLDGLQDLECLPCDSAHFRHAQCGHKTAEVKLVSSQAPLLNTSSVVMTACVTAVAMATILFVIIVVTYKGFNTIKQTFKGCLLPHSHHDIESASVSVVTACSLTQETAITHPGHSSVCTRPLPLKLSSVCTDITSSWMVCQPMRSHEDRVEQGAESEEETRGPVECTEREMLDGGREWHTEEMKRSSCGKIPAKSVTSENDLLTMDQATLR